jgi:hypothetical protein
MKNNEPIEARDSSRARDRGDRGGPSNTATPASGKRGADALAVATLLTAGVVIAWPVLTGGYLTYLDNPAHLAEVYAAAFEARNGWSEIAFCGFPIGTLHSPLWYGVLGWLVRTGLGAGPVYVACLFLGFVAPSLAMYRVARRVLAPLPAAILAWLLLVQRSAVVGVGSALGGMWTFYIASGALILLIDRLVRPCRTLRDLSWIAGLVGIILITHLYAVVPLALLALAHLWISVGRRRSDPLGVQWQAAAGALGVAAAAVYWIPLLAARGSVVVVPQNLDAGMVLARLAMPTHVFALINKTVPSVTASVAAASIPMIALIALGAAGVFFWKRRNDDAPVYGALVAATLLVLLLFVAGEFDVHWLGPGSWRMLYFVRIGLAFSAIPLLVRLTRGVTWDRRGYARGAAVSAAAAVVIGWWIGHPLREATPPAHAAEMAEVESLWDWLRENRGDDWGRVYLQDTFELPRADVKLSQSHVLALTAHRTGVRQLGATYGVAPYRTAVWTPSEFGTLFRRFVRDDEAAADVYGNAWVANVTHIVVSDGRTRQKLEDVDSGAFGNGGGFRKLHKTGRFSVFRAPVDCEWVRSSDRDVVVDSVVFETGRYRFKVRSGRRHGQLAARSTAFPGWRLTAPAGSKLRTGQRGLMVLEGFPTGEFEVEIEFRPDSRPAWLSAFCWIAIVAAFVARGRTPAFWR